MSCGKCEWCHSGQYRHCENTNWRTNPDAIRYGYTSDEKPPHLWGGFAQYMYLPWNAVMHHVPKGVTPELAGLVTPMANGVEWSLFDGSVGYNSTVLIQGPGQQGLSQTVICKQAGASLIIVTGTAKDRARMEVAKKLGADHVIDVSKEDPLARIMEITGGKGVDVALDCTAGAGTIPILLGIEALKRKAGIIVAQGEMREFPNFPLEKFTVKFITMKSARGHSYRACELALEQLASKRFPLELVTTHRFGLKDVDKAIKSVGGEGVPDVIHASLMPWDVEHERQDQDRDPHRRSRPASGRRSPEGRARSQPCARPAIRSSCAIRRCWSATPRPAGSTRSRQSTCCACPQPETATLGFGVTSARRRAAPRSRSAPPR